MYIYRAKNRSEVKVFNFISKQTANNFLYLCIYMNFQQIFTLTQSINVLMEIHVVCAIISSEFGKSSFQILSWYMFILCTSVLLKFYIAAVDGLCLHFLFYKFNASIKKCALKISRKSRAQHFLNAVLWKRMNSFKWVSFRSNFKTEKRAKTHTYTPTGW